MATGFLREKRANGGEGGTPLVPRSPLGRLSETIRFVRSDQLGGYPTERSTNRETEAGDPYVVREFRPDDTGGVLSLYESVFGVHRERDWFDWKYVDNPYVDHVPIVVAERDGEIVGARPCFALEMSVNGQRRLALQPADAMVHADHRRQGLFTRMTERVIERYESTGPAFLFNFPNRLSAAGNLKLGWRALPDRPTYYRFGDVPRVVAGRDGGLGSTAAGTVVGTVVQGYYTLREARIPATDEVHVRRESGVPARELAALYRERVPDAIHAVRDETFYSWRFGNPDWEYETYIGEGDRTVAMVVGTATTPSGTVAKVSDVVPLVTDGADRVNAALLRRVLADHSEAALVIAPALPHLEPTLNRFGFWKDTAVPLCFVSSPTRHVVRSLTGDLVVNRLDITDHRNWMMTFAEHDTS